MLKLLLLILLLLGGCTPNVAKVRERALSADKHFANIETAAQTLPPSAPKETILNEAKAGRQDIVELFGAAEGTQDTKSTLDKLLEFVWLIVGCGAAVLLIVGGTILWLMIRARFRRLGILAAKQNMQGLISAGRTMSGGFESAYRKRRAVRPK